MFRNLYLIGTTAFWLMMMSLLIQREFFQLTPIQTPYEVLPLYNAALRQEYHALYLGGERVGFNFTVLDHEDETPIKSFELRHQSYLTFLFLGHEEEMLIREKAKLNAQLNLQEFDVKVSAGDYSTHLIGQFAKGNLDLVIQGKGGQPARRILPVGREILVRRDERCLDFLR